MDIVLLKKLGRKVKITGAVGIDDFSVLLGGTGPVLSCADSKLYQKETDKIVSLVGFFQKLVAAEVKERLMKMKVCLKVGIVIRCNCLLFQIFSQMLCHFLVCTPGSGHSEGYTGDSRNEFIDFFRKSIVKADYLGTCFCNLFYKAVLIKLVDRISHRCGGN